jgi:uncharacterized membrane protein SpoIIM required for sporulation
MKESDFIQQNKEKWQHLELELSRGDEARPDKIADLYVESVDDLSFARTAYPNRMVRAYLNGVVEVLSLKVQRSQNSIGKNIVSFWKRDLPLAMFEAQRSFLISFLILAISIGIGMFSSMHDDSFASYILGTDYVATTLENIESGDPMAIYKDPAMTDMFARITINNILVSARTYLLSLFIGFGTVLIMIYNGVMIGAFQYFFIERGLFVESFLTIWQHGVIEISCIVLAGAAGLVLAKGILFPRSYSRLDSFRINGRKSLTIMMGIMPLLVLSGAIEAFVTRFTDVHWSIRLASILLSLSFIVIYFIVYPRMVRSRENEEPSVVTQPMSASKFSYGAIEKNVSVFWEAVRVITASDAWFKRSVGGMTLVVVGSCWVLYSIESFDFADFFGRFSDSVWYMHTEGELAYMLSFFLISLGAMMFAHRALYKAYDKLGLTSDLKSFKRNSILVSTGLSLVFAVSLTHSLVTVVFVILAPGIISLLVYVFYAFSEQSNPVTLVRETMPKGYGKLLALTSFVAFCWFLMMTVAGDLLVMIGREFISNFVLPNNQFATYYLLPLTFSVITIFITVSLVYVSYHQSYFGLKEIRTANRLSSRVDELFPETENNNQAGVGILSKNRLVT